MMATMTPNQNRTFMQRLGNSKTARNLVLGTAFMSISLTGTKTLATPQATADSLFSKEKDRTELASNGSLSLAAQKARIDSAISNEKTVLAAQRKSLQHDKDSLDAVYQSRIDSLNKEISDLSDLRVPEALGDGVITALKVIGVAFGTIFLIAIGRLLYKSCKDLISTFRKNKKESPETQTVEKQIG